MRKIITATAIAGGIAFGLASPAMASEVPCGTPAVDAVYKTVTTPGKPAVFRSEKVVTREAQPAVPEQGHFERVPVSEAVYEDQWHNWTGGPRDEKPEIGEDGWHEPNGAPKGKPHDVDYNVVYETGKGKADFFYWSRELVSEAVYENKWVVDVEGKPAIEEKSYIRDILVTPAVPERTERVLVTPEVPAGPECPVVPEEPVVPQKPVVNPEKPVTVVDKPQVVTQKRVSTFADETPAPVSQPELAMTGSDNGPLALLGAGMLGLGVILTALRKRFN